MKSQPIFTLKRFFLSLVASIAFVVIVSELVAVSNESPLVYFFLRPGSFVASVAGYGGHDLQGMVLYLVGNLVFYWLLVFVMLIIGQRIIGTTHRRV
jgi:hypothetical protein